ncbi:hypothetical protein ACIQ6U_21980 [Lysinibacillus fusiformis]|uniref:hypothetical protein n=1 Tax=Lysinibacillus fusiformis TaxID=28031 RepID=UPI00382C29CE
MTISTKTEETVVIKEVVKQVQAGNTQYSCLHGNHTMLSKTNLSLLLLPIRKQRRS